MADREALCNELLQLNWQIYLRHVQYVKSENLKRVVTFDRFSDFPVEIRDLIWEFSLPGPRTLYLTLKSESNRHYRPPLICEKYCNPPNPSALRVCRDSRAVALKRYQIIPGPPSRLIYADFPGGDTLYLDTSNYPIYPYVFKLPSGCIGLVERITVSSNVVRLSAFARAIVPSLTRIPNIKQFSLDISAERLTLDGHRWSEGPGIIHTERSTEFHQSNFYNRRAKLAMKYMIKNENEMTFAKDSRKAEFVLTYIKPNFPKDDWMVDLAETDEGIALIEKYHAMAPSTHTMSTRRQTSKRKSPPESSNIPSKKSKDSKGDEPAPQETREERHRR